MGWRNSIHGSVVEYDNQFLYLRGKPVGLASQFLTRGQLLFVDSAVDGGRGDSPDSAVGTLQEAIDLCTSGNYDQIVVMPGHSETYTGSSGILVDVDGVTITGLGAGGQRPTLIAGSSTATTTIITADNVKLKNLLFGANYGDIAACIGVGGASNVRLEGLVFRNYTGGSNFLTEIKAYGDNNTADGLSISGCKVDDVSADALEFLEIAGDISGLTLRNNTILKTAGVASPLILQATGKDTQFADIRWNYLHHQMTAGDLFIDNDQADNSGLVAHNRCRHADVTGAHSLIDMDGVGLFDNLSTSVDDASGFILPAIDSDA